MGNLTVKESGEMINFISPNVSNITSFKVHFSPRQEGSGDPSPENVREITGWNGVEGYSCGKNLFDSSKIINDARLNQYEELLGNVEDIVSDYIKVQPLNIYTISGFGNLAFNERHCWYDKDKNYLKSSAHTASDVCTLTVPSDAEYIKLTIKNNCIESTQIELGSQVTSYEPYQGATTTTDWTEDIGTVYGGYVDLISGELVQTHGLFTVDEPDTSWRLSAYNRITINFPRKYIFGSRLMPNISICTLLPNNHTNWNYGYIDNVASINNPHALSLNYTGDGGGWSEPFGEEATTENIKTHLEQLGFAICAPLATPITHQLTPQQLSTLKGQNNFWSNADYVEIEYELTETFDIQKAKRKIILNQPHVESASGDVVTFDTDMKGKLKECKVYFSPVQEGEGDPSPENIREITGWNGVEVIQTNQNLIRADDPNNPTLNYHARSSYNYIVYSEEEQAFTERDTIEHVGGGINEANHARINATKNDQARLFIAPKDGIYTFTCDYKNVGTNYGLRFYKVIDGVSTRLGDIHGDADELWHTRSFTVELNKGDSFRVYLYSNIYWRNFRVIEGDGTDYIENVTNDYSISWADSAGTVYGGYVDLASGELIAEWYSIPTTAWEQYKQNNGYKAYKALNQPTHASGIPILCNMVSKYASFSSSNMTENIIQPHGTVIGGVGTIYLALDENIDISNVQVVWKLTEPIHYQLTSQQILTLKGINNVYSNTNGQTEIKYWKH